MPPPRPRRAASDIPDDVVRLYGIHAVAAALANPHRKIKRLALTENAERRLAPPLGERTATVDRVRPNDLDRLLGADAVHQGAMLETEPLPEADLTDLAMSAAEAGPILVLDQVTDPHNVGAILRSAAVFGAAGLVMTRRHSAPLNGTLAKAASGALELVPVCLVQNLARTLQELAGMGVATIGLDGEGDVMLEDAPLSSSLALVLGAEGKGLRQLTRETCTMLCRIAGTGPLASLNVSNATAVALHQASMARRRARRA